MNLGTSIAALLIALAAAGSYWAGDHNRNNAWLAKQTVADQKAKKALDEEIERSRLADETHRAEQAMLFASYSTLEGKFNAVLQRPLVVFRDRRGSGVVATDVATSEAVGSSPGTAATAGAAGSEGSAGVPGLGLSLGAVWVWNSALAGADAPAGACGAADTTSEACAADSGIAIESAWQNHIDNAKSCAVDRLRHQRLIDYIQAHDSHVKGDAP